MQIGGIAAFFNNRKVNRSSSAFTFIARIDIFQSGTVRQEAYVFE